MTDKEATALLETVIDSLCEVGNGATDAELHKRADDLIRFRNEWFKKNSWQPIVEASHCKGGRNLGKDPNSRPLPPKGQGGGA